MRSGHLARLTGVSTDGLRHDERLGLLPRPQRMTLQMSNSPDGPSIR